jgi:O-antigen/teichoic acid export membrane protein
VAVTQLKNHLARLLPAGSVRARLAHGAFWSLVGSFAGQSLAAVLTILLARVLKKEIYGQWGMVQSTLSMFGLFAGLALGYVANKFVAESRSADPRRAGRILGMALTAALGSGAIVTAGVILTAGPLAVRTLAAPELAAIIRLGAPLLLLGALAGVQNGALAGFEAFRAQSAVAVTTAALTCGLTVGGGLLGGLRGAVLGNLLAATMNCVVLHVAVLRECRRFNVRVRYGMSREDRGLIWSFALPGLLAGAMVVPVVWASNAILVNTPGGYGELAEFNAANQWRTLLLFIPSILLAPFLPVMCQLQAEGQVERLRRLLVWAMTANVALVGAVALPVALCGRWIMRLYGPGFEQATPVLWLLLGVAVLLSAGNVVGNLIISTGAMWLGFAFNAVWGVVLLGCAAVLAPRHGALGLAESYLIAYSVHTVIQVGYFLRHCRRARGGVATPALAAA